MINMLRAGLYRLRPVAIPLAAFTALLLASLGLAATGALPPLSQAMRDLLGVAAPDGAAPRSPIDVAGRAGFDGSLLPYAASLPCLILVADDLGAGTFRTLLAARRSRLSYLLALLVIGLGSAALATALLLALCVLALLAAGVPVAVGDAGAAAWWCVLSVLVSWCYATIVASAALFARGPLTAWALYFAIALGLAGRVLALASVLLLGPGALQGLVLLPSVSAVALGLGEEVLAVPGAGFKVAFHPIFWIVVGALAGYARLRRRGF